MRKGINRDKNTSIYHRKGKGEEHRYLRLSLRSCKQLLGRGDIESFDDITAEDKEQMQRRVDHYAMHAEPHLDLPDVKPKIRLSWWSLSRLLCRTVTGIAQVKPSDRRFLAATISELDGDVDFSIVITNNPGDDITVRPGKLPAVNQFPCADSLAQALRIV